MKRGTWNWTPRFALGLVLVTMLAGCGSTATRQTAGEYIDDSVVSMNVRAAILNDPLLKVGQIGVETYNGVVQLSGFVNSQQDVARAGEVARSVDGVRSVTNSLSVKPNS